jgi:hypothetical protein
MCFGDSTEDGEYVVRVAEEGTVSVVAALAELAVGDEEDSTQRGDARNLGLSAPPFAVDSFCQPCSMVGFRQKGSGREELPVRDQTGSVVSAMDVAGYGEEADSVVSESRGVCS